MIYQSAQDCTNAKSKRLMLFGMSGLGKTYISELLRATGDWFHYSVDYRIGTRYMGEHITDNFKAEAMNNPFLAELLRNDAIYIASNITFNNLAPLSTYLGKPGDPEKGGIEFDAYVARQNQHRHAEISSMRDSLHFIGRAKRLYGYEHFVCDCSGSVIEVVDPDNPNDPVLNAVAENMLLVWLEGSETHTDILVERFKQAPKPMYYQPAFLQDCWARYLDETGLNPAQVDPDDFIVWGYRQLLEHRLPRYAQLAKNWGVSIKASALDGLTDSTEFDALVGEAIKVKHAN